MSIDLSKVTDKKVLEKENQPTGFEDDLLSDLNEEPEKPKRKRRKIKKEVRRRKSFALPEATICVVEGLAIERELSEADVLIEIVEFYKKKNKIK